MNQPAFSVIVPTRNRPEALRSCLESLANMTGPPGGFEVIVVDDGGTDPVDDVCAEFAESLDLELLTQQNRGPGAARNAGAARAQGEYIVFTGDDCLAGEDWLVHLARRFADRPDRLIGGAVLNGLPDEHLAAANQLLIDYLTETSNRDPERAVFFTPNNMAVPAATFRRVGGFDFTMGATGEDREFCHRWRSHGLEMTAANEAFVHHRHSQSLVKFLRQHVAYGRGSLRFHRRVTATCGEEAPRRRRVLPEPLPFYWRLLSFPFSRSRFPRAALLSANFALAQVATSLGFLLEFLSGSPRPVELEPIPGPQEPEGPEPSRSPRGPDQRS